MMTTMSLALLFDDGNNISSPWPSSSINHLSLTNTTEGKEAGRKDNEDRDVLLGHDDDILTL
jgi:hypothetical protein